MIATDRQSDVFQRLREVHRCCPEMHLGQLLATVAMLGEDSTGRSLWDIEDDELSAAVERFAGDLAQAHERLICHQSVAVLLAMMGWSARSRTSNRCSRSPAATPR